MFYIAIIRKDDNSPKGAKVIIDVPFDNEADAIHTFEELCEIFENNKPEDVKEALRTSSLEKEVYFINELLVGNLELSILTNLEDFGSKWTYSIPLYLKNV